MRNFELNSVTAQSFEVKISEDTFRNTGDALSLGPDSSSVVVTDQLICSK